MPDMVTSWWPYEAFFIASAGASAAILGLLVVAIAVVNADDGNPTTRELRTVLAGSAFVALVDIFMVSIVALTGRRRQRAGQPAPSRVLLAAAWPYDGLSCRRTG